MLRLTFTAIVIGFLGLAQSYALADTQTESMIKASLKAGLKSLGLSRFAADANSPPPWAPGPPHVHQAHRMIHRPTLWGTPGQWLSRQSGAVAKAFQFRYTGPPRLAMQRSFVPA